jgi:hypothetical protein
MLGAIAALLAGLFSLYRTWDIWDAAGDPLARYGNFLTANGLGVLAQLVMSVVIGVALLWLFVRLGRSRPLPRVSRSS